MSRLARVLPNCRTVLAGASALACDLRRQLMFVSHGFSPPPCPRPYGPQGSEERQAAFSSPVISTIAMGRWAAS